MKKLFFLAAAAAALFTSCATDDTQPAAVQTSEDFTAVVAGGRAELDGTAVYWNDGDELTIFTRTAHNRQYRVKSIDSSKKVATFGYVAYTGSDASTISANYAIYPYNAAATLSGDVIMTTLPAEQVFNSTKVDLVYAPMVAKSTTNDFEFVNATGLLRFKVKMAAGLPDVFTLESIKAESAANALAGTATIDLAGNATAEIAIDGNESKVVTLSGINTEITATEALFYMALPATQFAADDLKVTFVFAEGEKEFILPAFELSQSKIKNISYTIEPDDFTGSTGEYGETVELAAAEPEEVAAALTEALANPEVGQVILPEMPAGEELQIELTSTLTFGAAGRSAEANPGRNLIIDGNGATITFTGANRMVDVTKEAAGANLTLKNLTLVNGASYMERGVNYNTNGKLALDNVTIKGIDKGAATYAINLPSSSNNAQVEIKNCDICGNIALNLWGQNTQVTITDSTLSNYDDTEVENYPTIVLNNSGSVVASGSEVTITGGKLIALDQNGEPCTAVSNPALGTVTIDPSTEVVGELRNNVAIVTYEGYDLFYGCTTLQSAIKKAAETNAKAVKLIADITLDATIKIAAGQTFTLDLNGKNISYAVNNSGAQPIFYNEGDMSIKGEGKLSYVAANPDMAEIPGYATNTITNYGKLTIEEGVTIENGSNGGASYAVDNYKEFVMNGGKLLGDRCALRIAKFNKDDVRFTMNGGLVEAATPAWIHLPGSKSTDAPKITVTINGGTFQTTKESSADNNVLYTYSFGNSHTNTTINIAGGYFLGGTVSIGSGYTGDAPTLNITGGTFEYDVLQWLENDEVNVLYQANK